MNPMDFFWPRSKKSSYSQKNKPHSQFAGIIPWILLGFIEKKHAHSQHFFKQSVNLDNENGISTLRPRITLL